MGSEMCIRDRGEHAGDASGFAVESPHGDVERQVVVGDARFGAFGCLLYTSDAADERSSVDLGGRRIIKKKKRVI